MRALLLDLHLLQEQMEKVDASDFPVIADVEDKMKDAILAAKSDGDSVGGLIQTCIYGIPAGVGEPWFDSLESSISRAVFGIGGIKGIEFGSGFGFAGMRGSQANDPFRIRDGKVVTLTNHNGGINGGITNGMPWLQESGLQYGGKADTVYFQAAGNSGFPSCFRSVFITQRPS